MDSLVSCDVDNLYLADCQSHRTQAPLSFPPHVLAIASIFTAAVFESESTKLDGKALETQADSQLSVQDVIHLFGNKGSWEDRYSVTAGEVDGKLNIDADVAAKLKADCCRYHTCPH